MTWPPPYDYAYTAPPDAFYGYNEQTFLTPTPWGQPQTQAQSVAWELQPAAVESDSTGSSDALDSSGESSSNESMRSSNGSPGNPTKPPRSKKRAHVDRPLQLTARPPVKHSYLTQKEERDALAEEVRLLHQRVEELRLRAGLPTAKDKEIVAKVQARNFDFEENIHSSRLQLARMHSMVTKELLPANPLSTYIHLPVDATERNNLLRSMKDLKLRRAHEALSSYLESNDPHKREDRYTTDDGSYHYNFYSVEHFHGLDSARPLYDEMHFFFSNMEIKVTEELGRLSLREDVDDVDPTFWHQRMITEGVEGYPEEFNVVGFTRFYESHNGSQLGVFAYDCVDEDDLYPFKPEERTQKNLQACHSVSEWRRPGTNELVVVLKRCIFITQLPPAFQLPPSVLENLHRNMDSWVLVMTKFLRERMAEHRQQNQSV